MESGFFAVLIWVSEAGFAEVVVVLDRVATGAGGRDAEGVDFAGGRLTVGGGSHRLN